MRDLSLQQLVSSLLLTTTIFTTIAVDAFASSSGYRQRSRLPYSRHCTQRMDLFGRRDRKFIGEDGDAMNSYKNSKRNGVIQKDVQDMTLFTQQTRRRYRNIMKRKTRKLERYKKSKFRKAIETRFSGVRNKFRNIFFGNTIYVLECENNKYYVGSTTNRRKRYRQHLSERGGCKWTRLNKPIGIFAEYNRIPSRYLMGMESQITAEYMMEFGVNNVRGASFCQAYDYTIDDISALKSFLGHYNKLKYQLVYDELIKVLPDSRRSYNQRPPRVFKASNDSINKRKPRDFRGAATSKVRKAPRVLKATKKSINKSRPKKKLTSELPKAPRVLKETENSINGRKAKDAPKPTSERPKAPLRSKSQKRRDKRKRRRQGYELNASDQDNQTQDDQTNFKDQVDWKMEI